MKHKYTIGTWVRFYLSGKMVIGIIQYIKEHEPWEAETIYHTDLGTIEESRILEARTP